MLDSSSEEESKKETSESAIADVARKIPILHEYRKD